MDNILITGGTGFIGSHTILPFLKKGFKVTIIDSNVNSSQLSIKAIKKILKKDFDEEQILFFKGDIRDKVFLNNVFLKAIEEKYPIQSVIHFAGLKSVSESIKKPLLYWDNNVFGSICLIDVMNKYDCRNIVFSSSASIYANSNFELIRETSEINPTSPYGQTKLAIENILESIFKSSKKSWRVANLRYFNPIGAHESGLLGENPLKTHNLFPMICRVALGKKARLDIYGNDWPTFDGTGIRDYLHVMDLAEAHFTAFEFLLSKKPQILNLNIGTGIGTSVLELVNRFMQVNKCSV